MPLSTGGDESGAHGPRSQWIETAHVSTLESLAEHYDWSEEMRRAESLAAYRAGLGKSTVCRAAGITRQTLDNWIARA